MFIVKDNQYFHSIVTLATLVIVSVTMYKKKKNKKKKHTHKKDNNKQTKKYVYYCSKPINYYRSCHRTRVQSRSCVETLLIQNNDLNIVVESSVISVVCL